MGLDINECVRYKEISGNLLRVKSTGRSLRWTRRYRRGKEIETLHSIPGIRDVSYETWREDLGSSKDIHSSHQPSYCTWQSAVKL
ncbi:hypothetical protein Lal_00008349 [Lupinus albus]|nr:hypothetical protein Lal_00008349 [Lupinus albus]